MEQTYSKELVIVDIDNVDVHPLNDRPIDNEHVEELAGIFRERGLDDSKPIWAVKDGDTWYAIAGKHTLLGAKEAGLTQVFIVDKTNADALENLLDIVRTNISMPNDMLTVARNFLVAKNDYNLNQSEYAAKIGKSPQYVSTCLKALSLSESLGDEVNDLAPYKMSAISRAPEDKQLEIARKALENDWNIERINDEVSKERELEKYKDSPFEEAESKPEPTRELCFMVPLSLVDTVNDAIKKAQEESAEDEVKIRPGFALGLISGYYLGEVAS